MSQLEAMLAELDGRTLQLSEGRVSADGEIADGMLEIEFELTGRDGQSVIVEELLSAGSVFRIPRAGELALLAFVDGDLNEGFVLGWIPRPGASPASTRINAVPGTWVFPPDGEAFVVVTEDVRLGSEAASAPVALAPLVAQKDTLRETAYASHTHIHPLPLIPVGASPTAPPIPATLGSLDVGSPRVKAHAPTDVDPGALEAEE